MVIFSCFMTFFTKQRENCVDDRGWYEISLVPLSIYGLAIFVNKINQSSQTFFLYLSNQMPSSSSSIVYSYGEPRGDL